MLIVVLSHSVYLHTLVQRYSTFFHRGHKRVLAVVSQSAKKKLVMISRLLQIELNNYELIHRVYFNILAVSCRLNPKQWFNSNYLGVNKIPNSKLL